MAGRCGSFSPRVGRGTETRPRPRAGSSPGQRPPSPRRSGAAVGLLLAVLLLLFSPVAARADDLDTQARALAAELRCPVCQNLSAADSPSELAAQMRSVIRAKLAAGETRDAILDYFVERYGEDVLLDPPARGFDLLLYAGPLALGGLAIGVAGASLARWRRAGRARRRAPPAAGEALRP